MAQEMVVHRCAAFIVCAMLATVPAIASAQSPLAEAAKKAERQRQENGGRSRAFTDKDLRPSAGVASGYDAELYGTKLSIDRLERYSAARAEMVRAMLSDRDLDRRVSQQTINDFHDYEALLAAEPTFADRLSRAGITAHDYVYTEGALTIAEKLSASNAPPSKDLPPAVSENIGFYRVSKGTISEMLSEAKALEERLVARRGTKNSRKKP